MDPSGHTLKALNHIGDFVKLLEELTDYEHEYNESDDSGFITIKVDSKGDPILQNGKENSPQSNKNVTTSIPI